ncbi:hypothetical protein KQI86_16835 [Clostridium sp. MSJ-11]|uniref:Uncharacterized protein n=1 Tax=Clostridium mobile TaxID=2841512 RepID=A0ABS6EL98_9CLOT|nr:hypothetical protein [Clostridium mobile]MBU5485989.1 hypothetical protein [Clostridium mobile]
MSESEKNLLDRLSNKLPLNTGKDRMIKLDKNNSDDVEWYEKDVPRC